MKPFKKLSFCLLALVAVPFVPLLVSAQGDQAGVARTVEDAKKAGVPDSTVSRLLSLGYENGVDSASMAKIVSIIGEVKKEGLPLEPFVGKVEEGMAKRVPAASIQQVLTQKKQDYQFTRKIAADYLEKHGLRQPPEQEDIIGITESLYGGLSRQDVTRIVDHAPAVPVSALNRAINVRASLKQAGFDQKLSDQIVSTGLKHNFFTAQQRDFARAVAAGKRKGVSDARIAEAALSTMESGGTVAGFCSQIGVSSSDMGQHGPQMMSPSASMGGMGQSSGTNGMGGSGMSGSSGSGSSGMGGTSGGTGGMGGMGRGGGGMGRGGGGRR